MKPEEREQLLRDVEHLERSIGTPWSKRLASFAREQLAREPVGDDGERYVLVYVGDGHNLKFFEYQNLYLGSAILTDSAERAHLMPLDEAESKFNCMSVPDDWQIWSVRNGLVLDSRSTRHELLSQRAKAEKQIADIDKALGIPLTRAADGGGA